MARVTRINQDKGGGVSWLYTRLRSLSYCDKKSTSYKMRASSVRGRGVICSVREKYGVYSLRVA